MHAKQGVCLLLAACLLLGGCGGATSTRTLTDAGGPVSQNSTADIAPTPETELTLYQAPPLASAEFHADQANSENGVQLDLSALDEGYVAVAATSEKRLKFQVKKDDLTYTYDLASDGTPSVFPLQCGDGVYLFRVMENTSGNKYAERYSESADVVIAEPFSPFLRPSDYVPFSADSACVKLAAELAADAPDTLGVVTEIFTFICSTVVYDYDKAATVRSGYLPDPDETMTSGKGICFDYAALAAAMLRSQGVPTKMVFGFVSPNDLYHAWNMFYTEETGWVTVSYEVKGPDWNRLDLTFSAGGGDADFIGDGSNYTDLYFY